MDRHRRGLCSGALNRALELIIRCSRAEHATIDEPSPLHRSASGRAFCLDRDARDGADVPRLRATCQNTSYRPCSMGSGAGCAPLSPCLIAWFVDWGRAGQRIGYTVRGRDSQTVDTALRMDDRLARRFIVRIIQAAGARVDSGRVPVNRHPEDIIARFLPVGLQNMVVNNMLKYKKLMFILKHLQTNK